MFFLVRKIFLSTMLLILVFGATSFASAEGEMTEDMADHIFNYMFSGDILNNEELHSASNMTANVINTYAPSLSSVWTFKKTSWESFNNSTLIYNFYTSFNNATREINNNLGVENYIFISCFNIKGNGTPSSSIDIFAIPINSSNSDKLPYLSLYAYDRNETYGLYNIAVAPYGSNTSDTKIIKFTLDTNNNTVTHSDYGSFSTKYFLCVTQLFNGETTRQLLFSYENSDTVLYTPYNFVTLVNMPIYTNSDLTNTGTTNSARILKTFYIDNSSGGETGSGDTGEGTTTPDYSDDLDNIQAGISDINNNIGETNNKLDNISGELSNINNNLTTVPDISDTTITNDDITSNLDFEFEQDPYSNFWLELITGLGNSFTNNQREISIQFRDKTHVISLDNFSVQIPLALKPFLSIISTVFITWKMLQYIKIIIDNISSGNIDEVLEMNEEEGITNLF